MTKDELIRNHEQLCHMARELMKRKNADYAGRDGKEPFANFTRVEAMGICPTEVGFLLRLWNPANLRLQTSLLRIQ
jgi:hypothetical protein